MITKQMVIERALPVTGSIVKTFAQNGVELFYYGGDLCDIKIDGNGIDNLFDIPEPSGLDDSISLTDEAFDFILQRLNAFETKNKKLVIIPEETREHMLAHSDVKENHIAEAIAKVNLDETVSTFFMETISLGKEIGIDTCVEISPSDTVEMVVRPNRSGATPCVSRKGESTDKITVGVCFDEGKWQLFTAFYGIKAPREPWDCKSDSERKESEKFWATHALAIL